MTRFLLGFFLNRIIALAVLALAYSAYAGTSCRRDGVIGNAVSRALSDFARISDALR